MRLRVVSALAVGIIIGGCASGAASPSPPSSSQVSPGRPIAGPHEPDPACVAALKAEQDLRTHQDTDQTDQSAIDQDFLNFADALGNAAQHESNPATAKAMTALADDYTALVESQSGAAQLPDMSTVSGDGAAFDKACS
jgi:hypothetical protein